MHVYVECDYCPEIGRDHVETAEHVLPQCVGNEEVRYVLQ